MRGHGTARASPRGAGPQRVLPFRFLYVNVCARDEREEETLNGRFPHDFRRATFSHPRSRDTHEQRLCSLTFPEQLSRPSLHSLSVPVEKHTTAHTSRPPTLALRASYCISSAHGMAHEHTLCAITAGSVATFVRQAEQRAYSRWRRDGCRLGASLREVECVLNRSADHAHRRRRLAA